MKCRISVTSKAPYDVLIWVDGIGSAKQITECFNAGNIDVINNAMQSEGWSAARRHGTYVGGITSGGGERDKVENCYNIGSISANCTPVSYGGISGSGGNLINCYAIGDVSKATDDSSRGGILAGSADIYNAYYPMTADNRPPVGFIASNDTVKAFPLTTEQMKQQASFDGFDFDTIWAISPSVNNGYPYLRGLQP